MARPRVDFESFCCPFIDLNDPRCAEHFKLERANEAFELCLDEYRGCQIYHRFANPQPSVELTVRGNLRFHRPLV